MTRLMLSRLLSVAVIFVMTDGISDIANSGRKHFLWLTVEEIESIMEGR